jgi:hypothetical protein
MVELHMTYVHVDFIVLDMGSNTSLLVIIQTAQSHDNQPERRRRTTRRCMRSPIPAPSSMHARHELKYDNDAASSMTSKLDRISPLFGQRMVGVRAERSRDSLFCRYRRG